MPTRSASNPDMSRSYQPSPPPLHHYTPATETQPQQTYMNVVQQAASSSECCNMYQPDPNYWHKESDPSAWGNAKNAVFNSQDFERVSQQYPDYYIKKVDSPIVTKPLRTPTGYLQQKTSTPSPLARCRSEPATTYYRSSSPALNTPIVVGDSQQMSQESSEDIIENLESLNKPLESIRHSSSSQESNEDAKVVVRDSSLGSVVGAGLLVANNDQEIVSILPHTEASNDVNTVNVDTAAAPPGQDAVN